MVSLGNLKYRRGTSLLQKKILTTIAFIFGIEQKHSGSCCSLLTCSISIRVATEYAMPIHPSNILTFYPAYCFPKSPVFNTWAKLTAAHVRSLQERPGFEGNVAPRCFPHWIVPESCTYMLTIYNLLFPGQNIYFCLNHPIKWARLVGIIVAIDAYPSRWIMVLDDSSGATLEITCGRPTHNDSDVGSIPLANSSQVAEGLTATGRTINLTSVDVGTVVKVKGGIGTFRGEKQLLLERITILHTTNEETAAWIENTVFCKDVLCEPWFVSKMDEERARKKAEGLHRGQWAQKQRKHTKSAALVESAHAAGKHPAAYQETVEQHNADNGAAEKRHSEKRAMKRAEEKRLREEEFERVKSRKGILTLNMDQPHINVGDRTKVEPAVTQLETQDNISAALQTKKKKHAKDRRDEERRLREREFQRLKTLKILEEAEPPVRRQLRA